MHLLKKELSNLSREINNKKPVLKHVVNKTCGLDLSDMAEKCRKTKDGMKLN